VNAPGEIPQEVALRLQLAMIAGSEPETSLLELRPIARDGRPARRAFVPVRELDAAIAIVRRQRATVNAYVGCAPRVRKDGSAAATARAWCVWADVDGPDALERLRAFRPPPSIVIRSGSPDSAHAWWALRSAVSPEAAQRANRRLALALGADMKATDPARILRCAGTLNHKHDPPAKVQCTRLELDVFDLRDIVGGLPDSSHYQRPPARPRFETSNPTSVLAGLVRTVREARPPTGAQPGERNSALFWAACRAAEHVAGGELDAGEAHARLRDAALQTGLGEDEVDRTIRSALQTARAAA